MNSCAVASLKEKKIPLTRKALQSVIRSDGFVNFSLILNGPMAHPSGPDKPHGFNHNTVPQWGTPKEYYSEKNSVLCGF